MIGAYFTFRFGGRWAEGDSAALAETIRAMARDATLISPTGESYTSGYAFGAVSTFLLAFTGLTVPTLLQLVYPMISASLVVIAWPLYREFTGSGRGATLATLLLFVQPDFLFVVLRGSHERVLRGLLLLSLWLLLRSIRYGDRPRRYAAYALLFHVSVYGLIATNALFGSSWVLAVSVALVGSYLAAFLGPGVREVSLSTHRRLLYVPVAGTLLLSVFLGYIYPPAQFGLSQLPSIYTRVSRLFLTTSPEASSTSATAQFDPYAVVYAQWIDVRLYFLLAIGTYLLILGSATAWARMGLKWLARSGAPPTSGQWLMWLLYGAFMLQGVLAIVADQAATSFGANLQYRSFPSFAMVAAPMIATTLVRWRPDARKRALAAGGLGILTILAIVKATNEPTVSNVWTFYLPAELDAIRFAGRHLETAVIWADFDDRLAAALMLNDGAGSIAFGPIDPATRVYLISDVIYLRATRLKRLLPPISGELRVYDNGRAQLYRLRPRTPYQQ